MAEAPEGQNEFAGGDDTSDAAVAFAALRDEVARLRRFVAASEKGRPDYAPTLGTIAASLARIEGHPAMSLTPQAYVAQMRSSIDVANDLASQRLLDAAAKLERAAEGLKLEGGPMPSGAVQDLRVLQAGIAVMLGAAVWAALSGPVARALPASWAVPEKIAASTLGTDRWMAGQRMMASAKPDNWERVKQGAALVRENHKVLAICRNAALKASKPVQCSVKVAPDEQTS